MMVSKGYLEVICKALCSLKIAAAWLHVLIHPQLSEFPHYFALIPLSHRSHRHLYLLSCWSTLTTPRTMKRGHGLHTRRMAWSCLYSATMCMR